MNFPRCGLAVVIPKTYGETCARSEQEVLASNPALSDFFPGIGRRQLAPAPIMKEGGNNVLQLCHPSRFYNIRMNTKLIGAFNFFRLAGTAKDDDRHSASGFLL